MDFSLTNAIHCSVFSSFQPKYVNKTNCTVAVTKQFLYLQSSQRDKKNISSFKFVASI